MISVRNLTKSYALKDKRHYVFKDVSFDFPADKNIGILGPNGAGKSTLLRILGGIDHPDSGEIQRNASLSWPLGLRGGFVGHMTGRDNCRMICNAYGVKQAQLRDKIDSIKAMAQIGDYFDQPVAYYSSGMGSRLGFALSMAFDFDYFLIDEVTSVGDGHFKQLAKEALDQKRKTSKIIMVTHSMGDLKRFCDVAVLIKDGIVTIYEDFDAAIEAYLPKTEYAADAQSIFKRPAQQVNGSTLNGDKPNSESALLHNLIEARFTEVQQALTLQDELGGRAENALINAARLLAQVGHPQRALELVDHAIKIDAYQVQFWVFRANMLRQLKRLDAAREAIETGLKLDPKNPYVLSAKASLLLEDGNLPNAENEARKALMANPKAGNTWILLANIQIQQGHNEDALHSLQAAEEIMPDHGDLSRLNRLKGQVLFNQGKHAQALRFGQLAFTNEPAVKTNQDWNTLAEKLLTALESIQISQQTV
jgi:capsular polysaccharide transport system ATP-binding protein